MLTFKVIFPQMFKLMNVLLATVVERWLVTWSQCLPQLIGKAI